MEAEGMSLPLIHHHVMMPCNDLKKGDCCGRLEASSDGYYCKACDFFIHQKCGDEPCEYIEHPSHPGHILQLQTRVELERYHRKCDFCARDIVNLGYHCLICDFDLDLYCAKNPPPEVIDVSETHRHKLTLLKQAWFEPREFSCDGKCGKIGEGFHYKCHECDLAFHVDCVWNPPPESSLHLRTFEVKETLQVEHPLEVNHSSHSWHPLTKLLTGEPPDYSDRKCRLCGREIDTKLFYHCAPCNFSLGISCVLNPPAQHALDLKAHDHQLTLLPRLDLFTCNACGLKGDRSPYVCFHCGFMMHQDCLTLPRLININRHDHRLSRTSILGVVNSVCGVCRQKVDWTFGGYSCRKCPQYVVHSKCATRMDVWNGEELEGVPEEAEDREPYVVNRSQHNTTFQPRRALPKTQR